MARRCEIMKNLPKNKFGFLRENDEDAKKAGIDKVTQLPRTSLLKYLKAIFPEVKYWHHDKMLPSHNGKRLKYRPDYRCDKPSKLIVEFDGVHHYTKPSEIRKDSEKDTAYRKLGYKVVRIPFFIQLTKSAVKRLFGREVNFELFPDNIPSLGFGSITPASLPKAGINRMAHDFVAHPEQYEINIEALRGMEDEYLSGAEDLQQAYNREKKSFSKRVCNAAMS